VRRIARWHNMGQIPDEIVQTFGGRLSLAQVHAALAYYYANQAEIDADLEADDRETEALERQPRADLAESASYMPRRFGFARHDFQKAARRDNSNVVP